MGKVYVFLADGFEEIEGLTVVDILRRAGIDTVTVSISNKKEVTGSHKIELKADALFDEVNKEEAVMYVLPGGMPGTNYLAAHDGLRELLTEAEADGKKVAAICAAPSVLGGLGLLKGKKAICYPGFEEKLTGAEVTMAPVVEDDFVTTSRGMGTAIPFALALVAQLKDRKTADELAKAIIWSC
ncbi:MAG: DJ-1 family glyoxalase III [Candidatus Choladocola sp.]|nr:DJ-1 family glyoxalase III [Candidatus Choladocola sp.]